MSTRTIKPFVESMQIRDPMIYKNLTLVPIEAAQNDGPDYLLASEAIETSMLRITEVDEAGSVGELLVRSYSEALILIVDGQEFVGAKQNRIANVSVLLPPKAKILIPVSCVEHGRWDSNSTSFSGGGYAHGLASLQEMCGHHTQFDVEGRGRGRSGRGMG